MYNIPEKLRKPLLILAILFLVLLALNLPTLWSKISNRFDTFRTQVTYLIDPPDQAVFIPAQAGTQIANQVTSTPKATQLPGNASITPAKTATVLPATTPLPTSAILSGVVYVDQHNRWNYCGPANLTMALNFWGWEGNRDDVAKIVKPGENDPKLDFIQRGKADKNVMPYEMVDFVNNQTDLNAFQRYGGSADLLKKFLSNGIPVVIEKGYYERDYTGKTTWMGHYLFVTGYDDSQGVFIVQDAYLKPGQNVQVKYADFDEGWRSFNYLFMLVYPNDKQSIVQDLAGELIDLDTSARVSLARAQNDVVGATGMDAYFAWFNIGTSHVQLAEYNDAATAFDKAFQIYALLDESDVQRPYRMMWYQTAPYKAYYYTQRYQDVIVLANTTLNETLDKPTLEESLYWRAMAEIAIGDRYAGVSDLQKAVYYNPNMTIAINQLLELNASTVP